jgi:hypothetical protein
LPLQKSLETLASALALHQSLGRDDRRQFDRYVGHASPELVRELAMRDGLDVVLIGASVVYRKRGRKRTGELCTVGFIDALLEDWVRQTHRSISQAEGPGSPISFFIGVVRLMKDFPPDPHGCEIRTEAVGAVSRLWGETFEAALKSGVRSESTNKS